jgi:hypothetical protein
METSIKGVSKHHSKLDFFLVFIYLPRKNVTKVFVVLKQNSKKTGIFQEKETGFQDVSSVQSDLKTDEQQVRKKMLT